MEVGLTLEQNSPLRPCLLLLLLFVFDLAINHHLFLFPYTKFNGALFVPSSNTCTQVSVQQYDTVLNYKQARIHDHMLLAVWSLPASWSLLVFSAHFRKKKKKKTLFGPTGYQMDGHTLL